MATITPISAIGAVRGTANISSEPISATTLIVSR